MNFININEQIKAKHVRLIAEDGTQVGIVPLIEALEKAENAKLDLVEITPKAQPPVCKVMNYGKHLFEQKKKEKELRKKQTTISLKEIRLSVSIGTHDLETKKNQAIKFLENGDKVKVSLRFKGRQITHPEVARKLFDRFKNELSDVAAVDQNPILNGNTMSMILSAKN